MWHHLANRYTPTYIIYHVLSSVFRFLLLPILIFFPPNSLTSCLRQQCQNAALAHILGPLVDLQANTNLIGYQHYS